MSNNGPATLPGEEAKGKKLRKNGKGKKGPPSEEETSILKGNKGNGKGKKRIPSRRARKMLLATKSQQHSLAKIKEETF